MSPRLEKALIALAAAAVPLIGAAVGWVKANTEQREKQALADNYGEYIRDQMYEDEALERSLERCMSMLKEKK